MCEVPGKIVGAKLVLGIKSFGFEIIGPFLENRPVLGAKIRIALNLCQRGQQDKHITGLLDGHLVGFGPLAAAVNLPIGLRISAEIMGSKRPTPARGGRVIQNRYQHRFGQRGAKEKELRRHRIDHVHGSDAAIGKIFLGKHERLATGIGNDLIGGIALAIGERAHFGISFAACLGELGHELGIELLAPSLERSIIGVRLLQQSGSIIAVSTPVRTQVLFEYGYTHIHYAEQQDRSGDANQWMVGIRGALTEQISYQAWGGLQLRHQPAG